MSRGGNGPSRVGWARPRVYARALVLALLLLVLGTHVSAAPQPGVVHFTAVGDFASTSNASAVLNGINTIDSDFTLALGDLSYGATGQEQSWCDFVTSRVGAGYPFELVAGNHESNGQNGNINDFSACLPNQLPGAIGTYGRQYYVDVPAENPIVRFIMVSPGLPFPDGTIWNYNSGSARYVWTANAIDGARTASIPWVVVGMHKPCITVGMYTCESGADLFNLLVNKRVDLVLSGHEHTYQRSHQIAQGTGLHDGRAGQLRRGLRRGLRCCVHPGRRQRLRGRRHRREHPLQRQRRGPGGAVLPVDRRPEQDRRLGVAGCRGDRRLAAGVIHPGGRRHLHRLLHDHPRHDSQRAAGRVVHLLLHRPDLLLRRLRLIRLRRHDRQLCLGLR